jgi:heat shock protein HtpX
MPSLYTQADSNIHKTWLLISLFLVFIISLGWFFSIILESYLFLFIAVIIAVVQSSIGYWYSDKIVLSMANAKLIKKEDSLELYRIVENLSITAGLPMPKIYIMEEEQPNAFATGRDPTHSCIVVTRGLLKKLERSELEGVMAHELSHIGNRDIFLGTVIVVLVGVIAILARIFLRISFMGGSRRNSKNNLGFLMIALGVVAAILAPLAASLIRLSISRKREFLADASGSLLTRYPEGLIKALEKISKDETPLKKINNSTSHLYISSPFKGKQKKSWFTKLFRTHPPIEERIKALRR